MDHSVIIDARPGDLAHSEEAGKLAHSKEAAIEADIVGLKTLEHFSGTRRFNRWMYDQIAPFCKGRILEIGSGIGNLSGFLLSDHEEVTLSDIKPAYCRRLEETFGNRHSLRGVYPIDLAISDMSELYPQLMGTFDTVIALNVVEHIENHELAIRNARKLLKAGGMVVILVPAYQGLYNPQDKALGHFRRYTRQRLSGLLRGQDLEVVHTKYFNAAAIPGWWILGSLFRMKEMKSGLLNIYDRMVPMLKVIDRLCGRRVGLSVIAVAGRLR